MQALRLLAGAAITWSLLAPQPAAAARYRSASAIAEFKRQQPCPSNGMPRGPCPGYIIDHVQPLCADGADHPRNMQWQTVVDAKEKDRDEWRTCRLLRKSGL